MIKKKTLVTMGLIAGPIAAIAITAPITWAATREANNNSNEVIALEDDIGFVEHQYVGDEVGHVSLSANFNSETPYWVMWSTELFASINGDNWANQHKKRLRITPKDLSRGPTTIRRLNYVPALDKRDDKIEVIYTYDLDQSNKEYRHFASLQDELNIYDDLLEWNTMRSTGSFASERFWKEKTLNEGDGFSAYFNTLRIKPGSYALNGSLKDDVHFDKLIEEIQHGSDALVDDAASGMIHHGGHFDSNINFNLIDNEAILENADASILIDMPFMAIREWFEMNNSSDISLVGDDNGVVNWKLGYTFIDKDGLETLGAVNLKYDVKTQAIIKDDPKLNKEMDAYRTVREQARSELRETRHTFNLNIPIMDEVLPSLTTLKEIDDNLSYAGIQDAKIEATRILDYSDKSGTILFAYTLKDSEGFAFYEGEAAWTGFKKDYESKKTL